jgi:uncharacterized protein DUF3885
VPNAHERLAAFLAREFPGLGLHALSSRGEMWPSLRFELGGEIPNHDADKRVEQAVGRAAGIFEAAFAVEDEGFLAFTRWTLQDDARLLSLLPPGCVPTRTEGEDFWEQSEPNTPHVTYTAALNPRSLDYRTLFDLIGSHELARFPSIYGRAYLIDVVTPLIFHMYDDRGAMLVASTEGALAKVRTRFADWVIQ